MDTAGTKTARLDDGQGFDHHRDIDLLWQAVRVSRAWLDHHNGRDPHEITLRILKVMEEAGEVASARIGTLGQNPRKRVHHTAEDTGAELADVVMTALVAIESLGLDAHATLATCARKVLSRIEEPNTATST
jgi:NTP pyrophosphatase (non-canonical NTP hydrolase)